MIHDLQAKPAATFNSLARCRLGPLQGIQPTGPNAYSSRNGSDPGQLVHHFRSAEQRGSSAEPVPLAVVVTTATRLLLDQKPAGWAD